MLSFSLFALHTGESKPSAQQTATSQSGDAAKQACSLLMTLFKQGKRITLNDAEYLLALVIEVKAFLLNLGMTGGTLRLATMLLADMVSDACTAPS